MSCGYLTSYISLLKERDHRLYALSYKHLAPLERELFHEL